MPSTRLEDPDVAVAGIEHWAHPPRSRWTPPESVSHAAMILLHSHPCKTVKGKHFIRDTIELDLY